MLACPHCGNQLDRPLPHSHCAKCARTYWTEGSVTDFSPDRKEGVHFDPGHLALLAGLEEKSFWHRGRKETIRRIFRRFVPPGSKTLELGCGNGNVLAGLMEDGYDCTGAEFHLEGLKTAAQRVPAPLHRVDIENLPYRKEFDAVGLFDVLEHMDSESQTLSACGQTLRKDGLLVLTVPACPYLWGPFDEFSGHRRRYDRRSLMKALRQSGFEVVWVSYFFSLLFPFMLVRKALHRLSGQTTERIDLEKELVPGAFFNEVLHILHGIERAAIPRMTLPFGGSLAAVARKMEEGTA